MDLFYRKSAIDNSDNEVKHKWRAHFLCISLLFWFDLQKAFTSEQHNLLQPCSAVIPGCVLTQAITSAQFCSVAELPSGNRSEATNENDMKFAEVNLL